MPNQLRIATFNLENLDDTPPVSPSSPTFAERVALMRPQLLRVRADILCLQEVFGQGERQHFKLRALETLLADTSYIGFKRVSTVKFASPVATENLVLPIDVIPSTGNGRSVNHERNLVLLTHLDILEGRQIKYFYVSPPSYKTITAIYPQPDPHAEDHAKAEPIGLERPLLYVKVRLSPTQNIHVIIVHLKSKIPVDIPGQKESQYVWKTASGRAEGSFISSMRRLVQALEVRRLVDALFDEDENALIAVCGDFNAEESEVPLEAIRGDVEDTQNPQLVKRVLVPCEKTIPESSRFSLLHHGKGTMLDHILVSRSLLAFYRGTEIHNELLHDKSTAFVTNKMFPESDHAPVIAEFELQ
jgi:endonuclease/exonuclease/phosphatase family metal-dependent hydrolase